MGAKEIREIETLGVQISMLMREYEGLAAQLQKRREGYRRLALGKVLPQKVPENLGLYRNLVVKMNSLVFDAKKMLADDSYVPPSRTAAADSKQTDGRKTRPKVRRRAFFRIIIPNYNNVQYIKKCLDSVLEQTFKDYFCIVVDDQSTDDSPKVAQIYEERYPDRFKFIRLKKKGYAGAARNAGMDYPVDSEYTWFMDSDDWIYDSKVLERLHRNVIVNHYPDIVRCSKYVLGGGLGVNATNMRFFPEFTDFNRVISNGGQPQRNLVRSKFDCRFMENRAKNNDMVWFFRLYDRVNPSKVSLEPSACFVYNRLSQTSCQNNISMVLKRECTMAERLLTEDLKKERFKSNAISRYVKGSIQYRETWYMDEISLEEFFKHAYMITIDNQKFEKTKRIFRKNFNGMSPIKVWGSHDKNLTGPQNCTRSHLNIINYSKKKNLPFVVVFEDDAYPRVDAMRKLGQYLYRIPGNADFVLLGWSSQARGKNRQHFGLPFNRITNIICGSHAYIIFKSAYDRYINYMNAHPYATADCHIYNNVGNSYVLNVPIFIQYSDSKSMNGHTGYIFLGDHPTPPDGFPPIEVYEEGE